MINLKSKNKKEAFKRLNDILADWTRNPVDKSTLNATLDLISLLRTAERVMKSKEIQAFTVALVALAVSNPVKFGEIMTEVTNQIIFRVEGWGKA